MKTDHLEAIGAVIGAEFAQGGQSLAHNWAKWNAARARKGRQRGWDGLKFRTETGDNFTERDTPPERTPEGDYVFYHGTHESAVNSIRANGLRKDDIGAVGLGTRAGAVSVFALMKGGHARARILRVTIDKKWLQNRAVFTREGNHDDLFLVRHPREDPWSGIPREALKAIDDVSEDFYAGTIVEKARRPAVADEDRPDDVGLTKRERMRQAQHPAWPEGVGPRVPQPGVPLPDYED